MTPLDLCLKKSENAFKEKVIKQHVKMNSKIKVKLQEIIRAQLRHKKCDIKIHKRV